MKNIKKDFKYNLINKIKKEEIKPISKSFFVIKKIFIYSFLVFSIFIGALSLAIIFGYLFNADWVLNNKVGLVEMLTTFLPIFWLIFLILSIIISYFNFKKTSKGYKFYLWQIIGVNILLSIIIGVLFYFLGFSQFIEERIQNYLPKYREYFVADNISRMIKIWQNEDAGLLLGQIINVEDKSSNSNIILKDTNNKVWKIIISKDVIIKHNLKLKSGLKIKLIGKKKGDNIFEVYEIRPFLGKRKGD